MKRILSARLTLATALVLSLATFLSAGTIGPSGCGISAGGGTQAEYGSVPGSLGYVSNSFNYTNNVCGQLYSNSVMASGTVVVTALTDNGLYQFPFTQTADAKASAHSSLGQLGVSAAGDAASIPQSYFYDLGGQAQAVNNNYYASGGGGAQAYWTDTLQVRGNGPVDLRFTVATAGAMSFAPPPWASAIFTTMYCIDTQKYGCNLVLEYAGPGSMTATETFFPGDLVYVTGILVASANAQAGFNPYLLAYNSSASALADASDTALFNVDVLTAGGSCISASGMSYASTPEPASLMLLGSGVLGLLGVMRRRRRSPQTHRCLVRLHSKSDPSTLSASS